MHRNYGLINFTLRRCRVANMVDIIKVVNMFIKVTFQDSKKIKIIRNYVLKRNLYLYFLIEQNLLISIEQMLMLAELKGCIK